MRCRPPSTRPRRRLLTEPEPAPGEVELTPDDISESEGRYKFGMFFRRIWNRLSGNY